MVIYLIIYIFGLYIYKKNLTFIYILYIYTFLKRRGMTVLNGGKLEFFSSCSMGPSKKNQNQNQNLSGSEKIGIFLKPF